MAERIILITGGTGGLAQAIVKQLPASDQVILLGRNQKGLEDLYSSRPNTICLGVDIKDSSAIEQVLTNLYQKFGRIDVLINNAGFGEFKAFDDYQSQRIEEMFAVNTLATIHFSRLVGQKMAERGSGHIVNIASMAGLIASKKASIYSSTKFAVVGFSNALRLELAEKNVYVTTVNPGPISTNFFDTADPSGDYLKSVERFTLTPDQVAQKIVKSLDKPKRELNMPLALNLAHKFYTLCPNLADFLARKVFNYK